MVARTPEEKRAKATLYLQNLARSRGVKVIDRGNGHFQLQGPHLLVNYYPFSKNKTAYLAGTVQGVPNCNAEQAVAMARKAPKVVPAAQRDDRPGGTRKIRARMLGARTECKCHWCPTMINLDTSTLDHVVPLACGGLDNDNNRVLACEPCNQRRGHSMPELKQWPAPTDNSPPWKEDSDGDPAQQAPFGST